MTKKIFRFMLAVAIPVVLLCVALISGVLYDHFESIQEEQLRSVSYYVCHGYENEGSAYLDQIQDDSFRITWIDADGTVLFDNQADVSSMENHKDREEVQAALEQGSGMSVRYSETHLTKTIYYAVLLSDGRVLRVSATRSSIFALMYGLLLPFFFIILLAIILAAILSYRLSSRVVKPINEIDLEHPLKTDTYEELSPLLERISSQNREIAMRIAETRRQQQEFSMITENMSEGLFVVDCHYRILSCNRSALRIFGITREVVNQNLLIVNRSQVLRDSVDAAMHGKHCTEQMHLNGRAYQLIANPVINSEATDDSQRIEDDVKGIVILLLDITERDEQERYRREFTANVSHELKTPLTSISGIAEIIMNGIVKPADIPHFAGKIYDESKRLIALIGDIIQLSQIDENHVALEKESVDLLALANQTIESLQTEAEKNHIQMTVTGTSCTVWGMRQILEEMMYNICENAVKYNRPDGTVQITVGEDEEKHPYFSVKDTGIGIPKNEQSRVFERFYRVDKSHSKAVGGTGLGLSIVKHAAALHHGTIQLNSEENAGTEITVSFEPLDSSRY